MERSGPGERGWGQAIPFGSWNSRLLLIAPLAVCRDGCLSSSANSPLTQRLTNSGNFLPKCGNRWGRISGNGAHVESKAKASPAELSETAATAFAYSGIRIRLPYQTVRLRVRDLKLEGSVEIGDFMED